MPKFTKKPITIEAWQVSDLLDRMKKSATLLPKPILKELDRGLLEFGADCIDIGTLEGVMRACITDWIICGVKGELYPCKPDIFRATYEPCG